MRFMDVIQNGVLQAFRELPRAEHRQDERVSPLRARQLLAYKGERIERFICRSNGPLHIIID